MKEFHSNYNKKLYYFSVLTSIILMSAGLVAGNPQMANPGIGYAMHAALILVLSHCLLLYPKFESRGFRILTIIAASAYFYVLFFLYPETWSTFIFLCLIPAGSILFFDQKLFYFSLILNGILIFLTFNYISIIDNGVRFSHIEKDLIGNSVNFIGSQIIIFFIYHLTNRRIQKQRLYYEQVQNAERLKTTGQLAAAVAHEIRNPLTVVKGFLQYYAGDDDFNKEYKRNFSLLINELDSAEYVISQFLSIAKPDKENSLGKVDIKLMLDDVTDLLKTYGLFHDNQIHLQVQGDCFVSANSIELKQLLINLVKNAIEASPHGSPISVKAERHGDTIEIKVEDRGRGMSEEEVSFLGTPFYSLKSKGTGLGLMICYNIVEKYGGTIQFDSAIGSGTTVTLRFPHAAQ
ncbi:HAMP domain-containing histidine kinase [Rossellomorea vietnamensis]|uniref:histidine kinase n=1 Tax=Rossellomorea vietnamensis TaxID=218284 RepID=A0A5D4MAQ7_9BACI|nr:HAMP domain-containing histidine kinase [Rossellomorea vietnamensis]